MILGLVALGLGALILPAIYSGWAREYPSLAHLQYPALLLLGATLIPFFVALYQTMNLLRCIDANRAFSPLSVGALKKIKYSALGFSALYVLFLPIMYMVADVEDAPGLVVIGLGFTAAPIVIAVLTTVLEKLLREAIDAKNENDLTV